MSTWRRHRAQRNSRASSIVPSGGEGWTIRDYRAILHSEPYASADLGAASDVTAKSVQSEAASASSPTPISHQLTSDVIAGTRGTRVLWAGTGGKPRHVPGGRGGPIQRWFASTGTVSSRGLFAIYPRIFTATNIPSPAKRGEPLSKPAFVQLLGRCSLRGLTTVHGFRASFRTWASEQTDADFSVMELSLGHNVGSNVVEAYARGQLVAKRRFLMEQWGAFLTGTLPDWEFLIDPSLVVVPLRALRRDGARHWVRIFDLSRRELCDREVTIGQITVAGAEIVSGLDPDDLVALPLR